MRSRHQARGEEKLLMNMLMLEIRRLLNPHSNDALEQPFTRGMRQRPLSCGLISRKEDPWLSVIRNDSVCGSVDEFLYKTWPHL